MKKIFYILASAIVALGAVACQNEVDENINPNETQEISFNVSFDESTRIAGTVAHGTATFEFEGDETLKVGDAVLTQESAGVFTADAENSAKLNDLVDQTVTATVEDLGNGLKFASEEITLIAGENNVELSLACPALYFIVPANTANVNLKIGQDGDTIWFDKTPEDKAFFRGLEGTEVYIKYAVGTIVVKETTLTNLENKVYNLASLDAPVCDINGERGYFSINAAMAAAKDGDIINLYEGEYEVAAFNRKDSTVNNITVKGAGANLTTIYGPSSENDLPDIYANGLNITFEHLTITTKTDTTYDNGIGGAASVTFNECTILKEFYCQSGAPHYFNNCTIDPKTSYLYTWNSDVTLVECDFPVSNGKALQVYSDGNYHKTTTITDCTFLTSVQATTWDGKPVTPIDMNVANGATLKVIISRCEATGFPAGLNSGSTLWNNKCDMSNIDLTIDGKKYVGTAAQLQAALAQDVENIEVVMCADITYAGGTSEVFGGENTESVTIEGGNHTLTYTDSYRTYVQSKGVLTLNNMKLNRTTTNTDTHFYNNNMSFSTPVVMNNVVFNKGILLSGASKHILNNVTINKANVATYAMFIMAGCDVEIDGLKVNATAEGTRAIKIADEDITNPGLTKLSVKNSTFVSQKKAAVLVTTNGGAEITWGENNNIEGVVADTVNAVWVDEDRPATYDSIEVIGCTKILEGAPVVEKQARRVYVLDQGNWDEAIHSWNDNGDITGEWGTTLFTSTETINGMSFKYYEYDKSYDGQSVNYILFNKNDDYFRAQYDDVVLDSDKYFRINAVGELFEIDPNDLSTYKFALYIYDQNSVNSTHTLYYAATATGTGVVQTAKKDYNWKAYHQFVLDSEKIGTDFVVSIASQYNAETKSINNLSISKDIKTDLCIGYWNNSGNAGYWANGTTPYTSLLNN